MDWMRNLKMTLHYEGKEYILEKILVKINESTATPEEIASFNKHHDDATKVACIMVATMEPKLGKFYEDYWSYKMALDLAGMFHKKARQNRFEVVKSFMMCKLKEGETVFPHVQKIQRYMEKLHKLNVSFDDEFSIDMVLNSLPPSYDQFVLTYHLNNKETTLIELHNLLQTTEPGMKKNYVSTTSNAHVLVIGSGKGKKNKSPSQSGRKGRSCWRG
ncbi:uncharacterized protein LOC111913730 [Lactuca sativa]|uniref:uncharacterized protein LOC111913730 n=1 Tax=Lactuca sativa TaxID=4236 RepID=UPI000CD7F470|nr:uncharacterized protein LOC111913730 [Lactuca sativa]